MKSSEKKWICILLIILVIAIIAFVNSQKKKDNSSNEGATENKTENVYTEVLDDGTKLNTSEKANSTKEVNGFKFENFQITSKDSQTLILADVTNTTSSATKMTKVSVTLLDDRGQEIQTVHGLIVPLQPGAKTQFNVAATLDYSNVYDFKIAIEN